MDDVLLVGLSARSLAEAARAAGYGALAADLFCDLDTENIAVRSARIAGDLDHGLTWTPLIQALTALAEGRSPIGIVCGTGFEDRPELLNRLADRWRLYGNGAENCGADEGPGRTLRPLPTAWCLASEMGQHADGAELAVKTNRRSRRLACWNGFDARGLLAGRDRR